ncbi:hypothetical protein LMH87_010458 [Akanthomyces muscarius]|uniref:Zinc knuckle-domain-containing protein n=1 Tax=Akanthomyces muscarius TaxID=2231603 RepID=A0A9W8QGP8_AKAMU|nr:hypothetical protein LMH87_010458 [Akanthomyces muscarius]KAJ4153994.1 hypothetical protein LMH87_010458 [Akanthomyces muscarius]
MVYHRGPSRSTPANVQCQKCLKRGHYSYECNATAQERPYVSRPSRTQQLRNPKLVPKLTNDSPNPLEKKKGAADEELSKKEAERGRARELDEKDDESDESPRRPRSPSVDSVSTVSTNSRRGSRSPPRRLRDRHGSESGEEAGEIADSPPRRQPSRSAEMESVVAGLAHHGSEATKEKDMTITEITETIAANGKTMYQRPRQESAASVPSASVWP